MLTLTQKKIVHIYAGTSGAAGLYTHEIYEALKTNFEQKCIVNFYYPFRYGKCFFYRFTELSGINILKKFRYLRYILRYFELIIGLCRAAVLIINFRPGIVNYNLTSQNFVELLFLRFLKRITSARIVLTLHDVVPFSSTYINLNNPHKIRQLFISEADRILVHNNNSICDLLNNFSVDESNVVKHGFPIMDASFMHPISTGSTLKKSTEPYTFMFIGHGRPEKGLDLLVDAWARVLGENNCAQLIIAGNISSETSVFSKISNFSNVIIISNFLSDEEYFLLIKKADCLVLPYKIGTNSGIPSTAFSLGTDVICSSIPMFINNPLIDFDSVFQTESVDSLSEKLISKIKEGLNSKSDFKEALRNYRIEFTREINLVYERMLLN